MAQRSNQFGCMGVIATGDGSADVVTQHLGNRGDAGLRLVHQPSRQGRRRRLRQVLVLGDGVDLLTGQAAQGDTVLERDRGKSSCVRKRVWRTRAHRALTPVKRRPGRPPIAPNRFRRPETAGANEIVRIAEIR